MKLIFLQNKCMLKMQVPSNQNNLRVSLFLNKFESKLLNSNHKCSINKIESIYFVKAFYGDVIKRNLYCNYNELHTKVIYI